MIHLGKHSSSFAVLELLV